jgi:hypothetical protein
LGVQQDFYHQEVSNWNIIRERIKQLEVNRKDIVSVRNPNDFSKNAPSILSEESVRAIKQSHSPLSYRGPSSVLSRQSLVSSGIIRLKSSGSIHNSLQNLQNVEPSSSGGDGKTTSIPSASLYGGDGDLLNTSQGNRRAYQSIFAPNASQMQPLIPSFPLQSRIDNYVSSLLFTDSVKTQTLNDPVIDVTFTGTESLKQGLRSISVPKLNISPHLKSLMSGNMLEHLSEQTALNRDKNNKKRVKLSNMNKTMESVSLIARKSLFHRDKPSASSCKILDISNSASGDIMSVVTSYLEKFA